MSKVSIVGLTFHAKHGCHPEERKIGGQFEVDVTLQFDISAAAESDNIAKAVDYVSVMQMVSRVMKDPKNLIETVATDICKEGLKVFQEVQRIEVVVKKLAPPVEFELGYVSVSVALDR